jgi:hypothetical protein
VLEHIANFGHAFVLKCSERVYFRGSAYVLVMGIMVFDAFWTEWFDAGHSRAEVGEGLAFVLVAGLLDLLC